MSFSHFLTKNLKIVKRKKKFLGFELCFVEVKISRYTQAHKRLGRQILRDGHLTKIRFSRVSWRLSHGSSDSTLRRSIRLDKATDNVYLICNVYLIWLFTVQHASRGLALYFLPGTGTSHRVFGSCAGCSDIKQYASTNVNNRGRDGERGMTEVTKC